jgi:hypothetical protein
MKYTLLQIVQAVLSRAEDDPVNDIDDTEASEMAALRAKEEYFDLVDDVDWPHLNTVTQLTSVSDVTQPTVLEIPSEVVLMDDEEIIQYDITTAADTNSKYRDLIYKEPGEFLRFCNARNDSNTNVVKYTGYQSIPLLIEDDKMPEYWTSFDDEFIICDSFHSDTESTLQGSKTTVKAKKIPTWTHSNSFIPDLPENLFSTYISKVTTKYFLYHTQKFSQLDLQESQSGKARQRRKGSKTAGRNKPRKYGRHVR